MKSTCVVNKVGNIASLMNHKIPSRFSYYETMDVYNITNTLNTLKIYRTVELSIYRYVCDNHNKL